LLAALEAQDVETFEAALVDGASRWEIFRRITLPGIIPVSTTLILIRLIEGFKIIDLPNILTNGGPGTATESLTLESYIDCRVLVQGADKGGQRPRIYAIRRLTNYARQLALHPGRPGQRHHTSLYQHCSRRLRQRYADAAAGFSGCLCTGSLPVPAALGSHRQ